MFETTLTWAANRKQFGQPIGNYQLSQKKLTEMAIKAGGAYWPARQAAALQLAMEKGTLGLAMRNPNDKGWNPMEPMVVKEGQLTAASEALDPAAFITRLETQPQVAAYLLQTVRKRLSPAGWRPACSLPPHSLASPQATDAPF